MNKSSVLYSMLLVSVGLSSIQANLQQNVVESHRNRRSNRQNIEISGYISFDKAPSRIPPSSQLKVQFLDAQVADKASVTLAETLVDITTYKNGSPLLYNMTSKKPASHGQYDVSAVLNMGWKPSVGSNEWIRNGDYHTATAHKFHVNVTTSKVKYFKNITLELYDRSTGHRIMIDRHLLLIAVVFLFGSFLR